MGSPRRQTEPCGGVAIGTGAQGWAQAWKEAGIQAGKAPDSRERDKREGSRIMDAEVYDQSWRDPQSSSAAYTFLSERI